MTRQEAMGAYTPLRYSTPEDSMIQSSNKKSRCQHKMISATPGDYLPPHQLSPPIPLSLRGNKS